MALRRIAALIKNYFMIEQIAPSQILLLQDEKSLGAVARPGSLVSGTAARGARWRRLWLLEDRQFFEPREVDFVVSQGIQG